MTEEEQAVLDAAVKFAEIPMPASNPVDDNGFVWYLMRLGDAEIALVRAVEKLREAQ